MRVLKNGPPSRGAVHSPLREACCLASRSISPRASKQRGALSSMQRDALSLLWHEYHRAQSRSLCYLSADCPAFFETVYLLKRFPADLNRGFPNGHEWVIVSALIRERG